MTRTAVWPTDLPHEEASAAYRAQPFTLYKHLDADGVLLYVGVTDDLHRRTLTHRCASPWWPQVATVESELLPNHAVATAAERRLIREAGPLYNVVGAPDQSIPKARRAALLEDAT